MLDPTWLALAADPLALLGVLFLNFPICRTVAQQRLVAVSRKRRPKVKWYEDEDGEATNVSINESSHTTQVMGNVIWTIIGAGLAIVDLAFVSAELGTRNNRDRQLRLAMWVSDDIKASSSDCPLTDTRHFIYSNVGFFRRKRSALLISRLGCWEEPAD